MQVNVVRRETERQVEMRQRSYAWQLKEEEAEPWAELRRRGPGSREAAALWDSVMQPTGPELPMSLSRQQYLDLLVPGAGALLERLPLAWLPLPLRRVHAYTGCSSLRYPVSTTLRAAVLSGLAPMMLFMFQTFQQHSTTQAARQLMQVPTHHTHRPGV